MSTLSPHVKKCPRGHPVDGPRCFCCEQEDAAQEKKDDELLASLARLAKRGTLAPFISEILARDNSRESK